MVGVVCRFGYDVMILLRLRHGLVGDVAMSISLPCVVIAVVVLVPPPYHLRTAAAV